MKIIQLTDTHLLPPGATVHGVDPEAHLRAAVADILEKHGDTHLLVITGDLCNDGDPEAYALLREILSPFTCDIRLLLGNHDERPAFTTAFPEQRRDENGFIQSHLDTPFGRLLFLDSHGAGIIGGIYDTQRLAWLDDALGNAGEKPVTVFVHHPPVHSGIAHFENIEMHDDGLLLQRLAAHSAGSRHIVFGHIHVPLAGTSATGIAYSSGQACSHKFVTDIDAPDPFWTAGNPCYRIIQLDENGFRAYAAEVGETRTARAGPCAGP